MSIIIENEDFFTIEETAEDFNVNPETVRRWVRAGKLSVNTIPGDKKYLISKNEIVRFKTIIQGTSPIRTARINIVNELINSNTNVEGDTRFGLKFGQIITNDDIMRIFKVATIGGIRTKKNDNYAVVITSLGAHEKNNPYSDVWKDNVLYYVGEGQTGHQTRTKGNGLLFRQQTEDIKLNLFQYLAPYQYQHVGLFKVIGTSHANQPDLKGNNRDVIIFKMVPLTINDVGVVSTPLDKSALLKKITDIDTANKIETTIINKYKRNKRLVIMLKQLYDYKCQMCNSKTPLPIIDTKDGTNYVEVHHIYGFGETINQTSEENTTTYVVDSSKNVIVVCPYHHKFLHYYKKKLNYSSIEKAFTTDDGEKYLLYNLYPGHILG